MEYKVINPIPQEDIDYIINLYETQALNIELEYIDEGASGEVFKYKNYAIKSFFDEDNDGEILENFQDNPLFLKLYFYIPDKLMVTEYINITDGYDYYEKNVDIKYSSIDIFKYCLNKNYIPFDLHSANVVVTHNDELKIIDVGSFRYDDKITLNEVINNNNYACDLEELQCIIDHVKRPPIAI